MEFELSIWIDCVPEAAYALLRDKHAFAQPDDSPVLRLDKTTPGPVGVGTRYVEAVRMLPGEIHSEVTYLEPGARLEEDFWGAGMTGHLAYAFLPDGRGTQLVQQETIRWHGAARLLTPLIRLMLGRRLRARLADIKAYLESDPAQDR